MTCADISVEIPDETWMKRASEKHSYASFRVVSCFLDGSDGIMTVEIASEKDGVLETVKHADGVGSLKVLHDGRCTSVAWLRDLNPRLYRAAKESMAPIEMPFRIEDGEASVRVVAPHDRVSGFVSRLEEEGLEYELKQVKDAENEEVLTERQRRLVKKAVGSGYYDTPRRCSLTDIADGCGIAKSTCSDILHRAEGNVMKEFFGYSNAPRTQRS